MVVAACCLLAPLGCSPSQEPSPVPLLVFGAASLTDALEALAAGFEAVHPGVEVVVNVAGSSLLARQIDAGAQADLFFSANIAWMQYLEGRHHLAAPYRLLPIQTHLVVAGPAGVQPLPHLDRLRHVSRLAIADPDHVPAGQYAREALRCEGLWGDLEARIVPMLDVRAALLAVTHGAAEVAVVYASDVEITDEVAPLIRLPEACTPAIRYTAAVVRGTRQPVMAEAFLAYALAPAQQPIWQRVGFEPQTGILP